MGSFKYYNVETGELERLYYTTIASDDNLKVVVLDEGEKHIKSIEIANSPNSIYAIKGYNGQIVSINFFGEDKHKIKQIDLTHKHDGLQPHMHVLGEDKYHSATARKCNDEEIAIINKAKELSE